MIIDEAIDLREDLNRIIMKWWCGFWFFPFYNPQKVSGMETDKSTNVKVYAQTGTTLYVKHGSTLLAKQEYRKSGWHFVDA